MLFKRATLEGIRSGKITMAFRKWRSPQAKTGGTQKTSVGVLSIDAVDRIDEREVTDIDARKAGHAGAAEVRSILNEKNRGDIYRIKFHLVGPDPLIALRNQDHPTDAEREDVMRRLERLDKASPSGAWTKRIMVVISENAGMRSADLAHLVGQEQAAFKLNVRKLKRLGLTESLEVGYRISPRGSAIMDRYIDPENDL